MPHLNGDEVLEGLGHFAVFDVEVACVNEETYSSQYRYAIHIREGYSSQYRYAIHIREGYSSQYMYVVHILESIIINICILYI